MILYTWSSSKLASRQEKIKIKEPWITVTCHQVEKMCTGNIKGPSITYRCNKCFRTYSLLPIRTIHVFLSDFVRSWVYIDRMLSLTAHKLVPNNTTLLPNLWKSMKNFQIKILLTSEAGSFFKCQTDSTKRRFSVAYSFSRKERKWSLPAGSFSSSQP